MQAFSPAQVFLGYELFYSMLRIRRSSLSLSLSLSLLLAYLLSSMRPACQRSSALSPERAGVGRNLSLVC
ncbi:hypothetical protein ACMBCM_09780, partial [Spiroplasma sp. K1]